MKNRNYTPPMRPLYDDLVIWLQMTSSAHTHPLMAAQAMLLCFFVTCFCFPTTHASLHLFGLWFCFSQGDWYSYTAHTACSILLWSLFSYVSYFCVYILSFSFFLVECHVEYCKIKKRERIEISPKVCKKHLIRQRGRTVTVLLGPFNDMGWERERVHVTVWAWEWGLSCSLLLCLLRQLT